MTLPSGVSGAEIQQALDRLPEGGGEVVLPPGTFEIRQPIVLQRDHQILRGSGEATVLRLADDANCPVIILGEPVNHPQATIEDLRVSDLFIDGNRRHQQHELWQVRGAGSEIRNNGITVQKVSDSIVEHVTCARCRSGGLVTTLGVQRLTVRDLTAFDNEFDGLACYQTEHCLFTELHLHHNPGAGISLDLAFNHNVISNAVLAANDLGIFMRESCENQFHNITIHQSRHYGVFMAHTEQSTRGGWRPIPQTECVHNAFTNLIASHCGDAAFRVNNTTCTNNIIVQPKLQGNLRGGLSLAQPGLVIVQSFRSRPGILSLRAAPPGLSVQPDQTRKTELRSTPALGCSWTRLASSLLHNSGLRSPFGKDGAAGVFREGVENRTRGVCAPLPTSFFGLKFKFCRTLSRSRALLDFVSWHE